MRAALASILLLGRIAHAETPRDTPAAIEVDREDAPPGRVEHGFDSGAPVEGWGASVAIGLLARPIALHSSTDSYPVDHRGTVALGGVLALGDRIVVDAKLPLANQNGDRLQGFGDPRALERHVLGDLRIGGRIRVAGRPERAAFVRAELSLPTGNAANFAGESSWTLAWSLIGRLTLPHDIVTAVTGGIRLRGDEVLVANKVVGDEGFGAAGALVPVTSTLALTGEVAASVGDSIARKTGPSPIEVRGGLVTRIVPDLLVGVRAGGGLGDQIGSPAWRVTVEIAYQGSWRLIPRTASQDDSPDADDRDEP
jgi:hypothetical protein